MQTSAERSAELQPTIVC